MNGVKICGFKNNYVIKILVSTLVLVVVAVLLHSAIGSMEEFVLRSYICYGEQDSPFLESYFDIGSSAQGKERVWNGVCPYLMRMHNQIVRQDREDKTKILNLRRFNQRLRIWNAMLGARAKVSDEELLVLQTYMETFVLSSDARRDEKDNYNNNPYSRDVLKK
jgi:hypothetical protein